MDALVAIHVTYTINRHAPCSIKNDSYSVDSLTCNMCRSIRPSFQEPQYSTEVQLSDHIILIMYYSSYVEILGI